MRVVIDHIEEEVAVMEKEDGSVENMPKRLIPPEAKEGDVLLIQVDTENTVDRTQELLSILDEDWGGDDEDGDKES